jgi:hypothetical protein
MRLYVPLHAAQLDVVMEFKHTIGSGTISEIRSQVRLIGAATETSELIATTTSYVQYTHVITVPAASALLGTLANLQLGGEIDHDSASWSCTLFIRNDLTAATGGPGLIWRDV